MPAGERRPRSLESPAAPEASTARLSLGWRPEPTRERPDSPTRAAPASLGVLSDSQGMLAGSAAAGPTEPARLRDGSARLSRVRSIGDGATCTDPAAKTLHLSLPGLARCRENRPGMPAGLLPILPAPFASAKVESSPRAASPKKGRARRALRTSAGDPSSVRTVPLRSPVGTVKLAAAAPRRRSYSAAADSHGPSLRTRTTVMAPPWRRFARLLRLECAVRVPDTVERPASEPSCRPSRLGVPDAQPAPTDSEVRPLSISRSLGCLLEIGRAHV